MHLLYTDETNVNPNTSDFFTYAGVAIPGEQAGSLSARIDAIRAAHGYKADDLLKFNTRERPTHVTSEQHRNAKQQLLAEAAGHGVRLFCSFVLHRVATKGAEDARLKEINRICLHFNYYLNRIHDHGLVLIDTFPNNGLFTILKHKFLVGLKGLPYSESYRLDRLLGLHVASIGSSHFCSVVDVVLGSLRHAVNCRNDPQRQSVCQTLLTQLSPLVVRNGAGKVDELSFFFSPKTIRTPSFLQEYLGLHAYLAANGLDCQQVPVGP